MTKEIAESLPTGRTIYHKTWTNADGSAFRARVNGRIKTWKREPERWLLPIKRGLRDCGYLGEGPGADQSPSDWTTTEPVTKKDRERFAKLVGLSAETPLRILADALTDAGKTWQAERITDYLANGGK